MEVIISFRQDSINKNFDSISNKIITMLLKMGEP